MCLTSLTEDVLVDRPDLWLGGGLALIVGELVQDDLDGYVMTSGLDGYRLRSE